MEWTKDEIDKYVAKVRRLCANAHEPNIKGFAFAKLYKEVSDYESAKRYLEAYISEKETDFRGHCLMGQLYEGVGELEKAVASYRRSLELNNSQKELVLKVVKLYCSVPVHPERAKAWADRGARLFPGHPDVFSLRLHLLESAEVVDYDALEDLISEELSKRPREVDLHVRLVRLYAVRGRLDEAFTHCVTVLKTKAFQDSLPWIACCVEMFEKYLASLEKHLLEDEAVGAGNSMLDVHAYLLIALCQFLELNLHECSTREVINVLFRLDHCLFMADGRKIRQSPRRSASGGPTEWEVILVEMKAQLYMYCGTLLIRLAKEKFVTWPRGLRFACACYLASVSIPPPETKTPWVARAPKNKDPLKWYIMACSRLSQTGHFLMATRDKLGQDWLDMCYTDCCSRQGKHDILSTIYRDVRDLNKSFLAFDEDFCENELTIPEVDQLVSWDEVAVRENPRSLEKITWIGLHWYQYNKEMRPGVGTMVKDIFPELRLDVLSIQKQIAPNMLCLRDLEAFVYAIVRTSAARVLEDKDIVYEDYEPQILPQPLCNTLSLPVQQEWWTCAYNLYTGKYSVKDSNRTCHTVQCGMEKIRAVDERHGLQVQLLIYLAKAFGSKATYLKGSVPNPWFYEEHWKSMEKWSLHYFRQAAKILEMHEKNESIPYCENPLFPHVFDELQENDLKTQFQSVRLAIGGGLLKEGKIFEAMELFEMVKTPPGLYNLAQGYKYLAHVEQCAATEESEAETTLPSQEYYQNLRKAGELLQSYLKITNPSDIGRKAVVDELTEIENLIRTGVLQSKPASGHRLDSHHSSSYPGSRRSSTNASEVQESDDNFWLEQPHDASTKDLIAKLSEVTLNNGYLQEQMAIRDEAMNSMSEQIQHLQKQISMLQASSYGYLSFPDATSLYPSPKDQSRPMFESTPAGTKQMSLSEGGKPLTSPRIKGSLKIDSSFFAGLSASNSPEKRVEQVEELVTSPVSPGRPRHDSSTSYTEDVHFEPLIPLPERVEVQTGEEAEEVMFSSRAKLYRYDKDVSAWKERGIGILKILYNSEKGRSRILMRREAIHKICANHFITDDMKLTEKKGTTNAWIWNTFADYSEEIGKPEQLAVRFKTQDEFLLFKEKFEHCQNLPKKDTSNVHKTAQSANKISDFMTKLAPKPGCWSCSVCWISNEERTCVCMACGAAKLSEGNASVSPEASKSCFQLVSPIGLQGKPSPDGSFTVRNVKTGTAFTAANSALGTSDGTSNSFPFSFALGKDGQKTIDTGATESQVEFGENLDTASSNLPFRFLLREGVTRMENSSSSGSPFAFGTSSAGIVGNTASGSDKGAFTVPAGTKPTTAQSFVLAPFGVPANADKSNSPAFTFGSSSMTGSSLPSLTTEKAAFENTVSFGSFNTGRSPTFDPDLSASDTRTDPLPSERSDVDSQVPQNVSEHALQGQTYPPFSFSTPTTNLGISEQKLFWQQPTGSFQFGQLQSLPPLGGANWWHRGTGPLSDPAKTQLKSTSQTSEMLPRPLTVFPHAQMQGAFTLSSRPVMEFSSSELLRCLAAAKEQQELVAPDSPAEGYDFTPYVVDEPGEESYSLGTTMPTSFVAEEYDRNDDDDDEYVEDLDESEDSDDETSSYLATDDEEDELDKSPARMPVMQPSQVQVQFQSSKGNVVTTPVKPIPIHSTPPESVGPATLPSHMTGRRFLTAKSPLKATKKQDEDCFVVYEVRAPMSDRDKACRLCLPLNFFNYTKHASCSGCYGCGKSKEPMISKRENEVENTMPKFQDSDSRPDQCLPTSHVFGESSSIGQLTFSSLKPREGDAFSVTQKKESFKPFQGAGKQLFAETSEDVEGQDDDKLHFEPIIALPDEIQIVTGEEGLDVLFCERAKLYRFDSDSSQWKERGVGEMKLLRHPKSCQGRVLMRREQIKKLCANHYISAGMELKPNVGSDRSWVWYTPADYAEGEAKPERLAIKFKSAEIAGKFKEVFDDLRETLPSETSPEKEVTGDEQETGCALFKQFMSRFAPASGSWTCEVCDVDNDAEHLQCNACNSVKTAREPQRTVSIGMEENLKPSGPMSNAAVPQSEPANTAQDVKKESCQVVSIFQSPGGSALASSKLFTVGRGDPNEEKEDKIYLSPSKTSSPSQQRIILSQKPSTSPGQSYLPSSLPFGSTTPVKFTFSLTVSPGSPSRKPKSPSSPATPSSPESPSRGEDDGPYFEPLIPLPDKVECRTGEEGQEVLFCERCKLFRYDGGASQWKERGIGEIKILRDSNSNKNRILMRREHVLKLCANHSILTDMVLKPFPNSDKAWLWTTLADFSEEEATAETLAARFRTSEVAAKFKETFDIAIQAPVSKPEKGPSLSKPESKPPDSRTSEKPEEDVMIMFEKGVTADLKEKAKRLQLPSNFFRYECSAPEVSSDLSETDARQSDQPTSDPIPEGSSTTTSNKTGFLFGSASVSSLTFQSIVASSLGSSPFGQKTQGTFGGFSGAGSQLFASQNADEDDEAGDGNHDGPHFEPIIPLPEKIDVKTGEEDEEVIFSHRTKLYRFAAEDKQWKERGVGDIKLLKNRQSGKMRVLMRRDQVLKICANHQITAEMKLQPNAGSDRSWVWSTMADFSEGECKAEQLAVRFKSEDIAKLFKEKFEECQGMLRNQTPVKLQVTPKTTDAKEDLVTKFKPAEGSWECSDCMVNNDSDKVQCSACGNVKPGAEPRQGQKKEANASFSFGGSSLSSSGGGFMFGSGGSSQEGDTKPVFTFGSSNQKSNPSSGFSFTFGSLKQAGPGSEQQTEDTNGNLSLFNEQKPDEEADDSKDGHDGQELSENQSSANLAKEERINEDARKDVMTKFQPAEGSWECETCMVNNERDKVECAACGSVKSGAEVIKEQKEDSKSLFPFGFGSSSSGGVFSFGSSGTSQGDSKPVFTFGSQNQTSTPSSGVAFSFGSIDQGENLSEQETKRNPKAGSLTDPADNEGADDTKDDQNQNIQEGVDVKEKAQVEEVGTKEDSSTLESDKDSAPAMQDTKDTLPNKEQKFLFGSPNVSSLSFQSIASSSLSNSPFGKKPTSGNSPSGFPGLGTKLFTTPHSADRDESTTEEDHEGPHFEPIIPLPEKIDVKTGEEDEEVMFSRRAKLYRFVAEDKQWKERGVGDLKLLKNRRSGKIRVLMRRDQVLKICANHQITAEMKLKPNAGSEKSWAWSTMADFSEQECRAERLAVRFKSEDIAKQFKEKFEECQEMLKNSTLMESRVQPKFTDAKEDLVAKFKPTEGSWECSICMVNNDSDKVACAACGSVKGGAKPSHGQKEGTKPLFAFGSEASSFGGRFTFGSGGINQGGDTKPAFTYGGLSKTKNQFSGFSFSFGTLKQGGIVSDQQSKATKSSLSSLFEPKPGNKVGISKHDHERQEKTKNQTSFKAKKEETKCHQAEKGIMAKLKADKRLWECSVCMVKNDIDKVACAACGSVKGGAEPSRDQKEETKPIFVFGSGALSSGEGFTFGSGGANQGGDTKPAFTFGDSKQTSNLSSGFSFSFGSVTSGGLGSEQQSKATKSTFSSLYEPNPGDKAGNFKYDHERQERQGFTFGLSGKSQKSKTKPVFNSGGLNQTPYPDTVFSFKPGGGFSNQQSKDTSGSLSSLFKQMHGKEADNTKNDHERQEMLKNRLLLIATKDEKKIKDTRKDNVAKFKNTIGSWKCEICMVNNVSDKVECAACGSVKSGAEVIKEQKQDSKSLFTFGFGASSCGGVFSFGSGGTSQGDSKPVFTFGSQN